MFSPGVRDSTSAFKFDNLVKLNIATTLSEMSSGKWGFSKNLDLRSRLFCGLFAGFF